MASLKVVTSFWIPIFSSNCLGSSLCPNPLLTPSSFSVWNPDWGLAHSKISATDCCMCGRTEGLSLPSLTWVMLLCDSRYALCEHVCGTELLTPLVETGDNVRVLSLASMLLPECGAPAAGAFRHFYVKLSAWRGQRCGSTVDLACWLTLSPFIYESVWIWWATALWVFIITSEPQALGKNS